MKLEELVNEEWAEFEAYFVNPNKPTMLRSLNTAAVKHTQEEMKKMVFGDDASRPEQLTRVYLLQLNDAIESFEQKIGRIPESLEEMAAIGDVNVFYINPFTKAPVKNTDKLSPGDYMYRRFKADDSSGEYFYEVVGWGEKEPVYYFSTDESREMFDWNETDADETI